MAWITCLYYCMKLWKIFHVLQGEITYIILSIFPYSVDRGLENELLTTQENYETLRESFSHKYGLENLPRTPLTFECRKEIVYSIQHNIRSKEQQCESERLRVEQVVDSITTATKNSEREVFSACYSPLFCKLEVALSGYFTTKAPLKRLKCYRKANENTSGEDFRKIKFYFD